MGESDHPDPVPPAMYGPMPRGERLVGIDFVRGMALLGFEAHVMTVEQHQELASLDGAPTLVASGRLIEELRTVKDESELALLARDHPALLHGPRQHRGSRDV